VSRVGLDIDDIHAAVVTRERLMAAIEIGADMVANPRNPSPFEVLRRADRHPPAGLIRPVVVVTDRADQAGAPRPSTPSSP